MSCINFKSEEIWFYLLTAGYDKHKKRKRIEDVEDRGCEERGGNNWDSNQGCDSFRPF